MDSLLQDLRYAIRMLVRSPGFAAVAVITLALGIGANTAIFSVVHALLLRPFPYGAPERLVTIWESSPGRNLPYMYASPPNFSDWRTHSRSFEGLAAVAARSVFLQSHDESLQLPGAQVSGETFHLLQVSPALGRGILAEDDQPGAEPVVVLSHNLWQSRFAADPLLLGQTITLNERPHRVVGVMPAGFYFPPPIALEGPPPAEAVELWTPFAIDAAAASRGARYMTVIGRLKEGVSLERAQANLSAIAQGLQQEYPATNEGWRTRLVSLDAQVLGDLRPVVLTLLGAVAFVLLIACVNVTNLLMARARARQHEFAVRAALGASRGRLVRQWVTETTLLALLGGAAGLALASVALDLMLLFGPRTIPRLDETSINSTVLVFTFVLSLLTGCLVGLLPAFRGGARNLMSELREGRGGGPATVSSAFRSALVSAELALSLVLLVAAGLLLRSLLELRGVDKGFEEASVLTLRLAMPQHRYQENAVRVTAYRGLEGRLQALPETLAAGFTFDIPLGADRQGTSFRLEGEAAPESQTNFTIVTPGYFGAMGTALLRGRNFAEHDGVDAPAVVIVNRAFADRFLQGREAIGYRLEMGFQEGVWREIIGVIAAVRHDRLQRDPAPGVYLPYYQLPWSSSMSAAVRTRGAPADSLAALRREIHAFEPAASIYDVRPMEEVVADSIARPRFLTFLLGAFSWVALLLTCVGVYGVVNFSVSQRSHEIGVRMALGARRGEIFRMVVHQAMAPAIVGLAAGVVAALVLGWLMRSLLFAVPSWDPLTIIVTSALLLLVTLAACCMPARRATHVDPMVVLRQE